MEIEIYMAVGARITLAEVMRAYVLVGYTKVAVLG